jgi:hypothetical protein
MSDRASITDSDETVASLDTTLDVSCETALWWHRSGKLPGGRRLVSNVLRFSEPEVEALRKAGAEAHVWLPTKR